MRAWLYALGGLLIWAGHFFALYAAASVFPGTLLARWITVALTTLALGLLAVFARRIGKRARETEISKLERWTDGLAYLGVAIAAISIVMQGIPAAVG